MSLLFVFTAIPLSLAVFILSGFVFAFTKTSSERRVVQGALAFAAILMFLALQVGYHYGR